MPKLNPKHTAIKIRRILVDYLLFSAEKTSSHRNGVFMATSNGQQLMRCILFCAWLIIDQYIFGLLLHWYDIVLFTYNLLEFSVIDDMVCYVIFRTLLYFVMNRMLYSDVFWLSLYYFDASSFGSICFIVYGTLMF